MRIFSGNNAAQNLTQASGENATGAQQPRSMLQPSSRPCCSICQERAAATPVVRGPFAYADDGDLGVNAYAATGRKRSGAERDACGMVTKGSGCAGVRSRLGGVGDGLRRFVPTTQGSAAQGSSGSSSTLYGAAVGADYRVAPNTVAGFALAGAGTRLYDQGWPRQRPVGPVPGRRVRSPELGAAYLSGALAYGWQDVTTDRTVTIAGLDRLHASFNANTYSGRIGGGYRFVDALDGG